MLYLISYFCYFLIASTSQQSTVSFCIIVYCSLYSQAAIETFLCHICAELTACAMQMTELMTFLCLGYNVVQCVCV
jgi:hypothetical protein